MFFLIFSRVTSWSQAKSDTLKLHDLLGLESTHLSSEEPVVILILLNRLSIRTLVFQRYYPFLGVVQAHMIIWSMSVRALLISEREITIIGAASLNIF